MLKFNFGAEEHYDEASQTFVEVGGTPIELEHSLVSMSKWESKFEKPFLAPGEKSTAETLTYITMMILTPDLPPNVVEQFTNNDISKVNDYIDAKMTATWFRETRPTGPSRQQITSELVYYWMTSYQIPWEAQYWHLNRLFTLIRVFNAQNAKQPKRTTKDIAAERQALNAQRRAQMNSNG